MNYSPETIVYPNSVSAMHSDTDESHVLPIKTYLKIYGALLFLTYVTVQVSIFNFGTASIYIAMLVAIVKATLVAAYFMHLKFDSQFNTLVFGASLIWLVIFFSLTMVDLTSRGDVLTEERNFGVPRVNPPGKSVPAPSPK